MYHFVLYSIKQSEVYHIATKVQAEKPIFYLLYLLKINDIQ